MEIVNESRGSSPLFVGDNRGTWSSTWPGEGFATGSRVSFGSPYLDWGTGGGASFKAMPFRTGPAGSPPSPADPKGGDLRRNQGPVTSGAEPAETHEDDHLGQ
jgi:hypothetical protein